MSDLTCDDIKELVSYDPVSGKMFWKARGIKFFDAQHFGKEVGHTDKHGYKAVFLGKKNYFLHRLIWLYSHGSWPDGVIDHINGIRQDNRLENLRVVTASDNSKNARFKNKTGYQGVHANRDKFVARLSVGGKSTYLGMFDSAEDASKVYHAEKIKHGFHVNHGT